MQRYTMGTKRELTANDIASLEKRGFKRWQKGSMDRLYVNASTLGLECSYYKTGNISGAWFQGSQISHAEGGRMQAAKTYIDVADGTVHSDNDTLAEAANAILAEVV